MNGKACTIGNRLLVHLSCFSRYNGQYVCPPEMTQDGMSQKLGISRAHAALELKRMRERNHVEYRLTHVVKAKTRRKVYQLTQTGELMANELKEGARRKRVRVINGNGGVECSGQEALKLLCAQGLSESEAFSRILMSEAIPVTNGHKNVRGPAVNEILVGREQEMARLTRWFKSPGKAVCVLTGADGMGKSSLARQLLSEAPEHSLRLRVRQMQSTLSVLSEIVPSLEKHGRNRLAGLLSSDCHEKGEAVLALAEDMAGGLLVLDDIHKSPEIEEFASLFLTMNDWPFKILLVGRRKPGFCKRWSDTFQRPYEDVPIGGLDSESAKKLLNQHGKPLTDVSLAVALASSRGCPLDLVLLAQAGWSFETNGAPRCADSLFAGLGEEEMGLVRLSAVLRGPIDPASLGLSPAQCALAKRKSLFAEEDAGFFLHESLKAIVVGQIGEQESRVLHEKAAGIEESRGKLVEAAGHYMAAGKREEAVRVLARGGDILPWRDSSPELLVLLRAIGQKDSLELAFGLVLENQGKLDEARQHFARATAVADRAGLADALLHLASVEIALSLFGDAEKHALAAVATARETDDKVRRAEATQCLGRIAERIGEGKKAAQRYREACEILEEAGAREEAAKCRLSLGKVELDGGNVADAVAELTTAIQILGQSTPDSAEILHSLGRAHHELGDMDCAIAHFAKSEEVALSFGRYRIATRSLTAAAGTLLRGKKMDESENLCRRALRLGERLGDKALLSQVHATMGRISQERGMWSKAESHMITSIECLKFLNNPETLANRYEDLASLYRKAGDSRKARLWSTRAKKMMEWEEPRDSVATPQRPDIASGG